MGRLAVAAAVPAVAVLAVAPAGCGGTGQLLRRPGSGSAPGRTVVTRVSPARLPPTASAPGSDGSAPSAVSVYLARLGGEQTKLAQAEQTIPTSPRTPAALAHSVALLRAAVARLADGLAAIQPPASVAADHGRLIAIMRAYAVQLGRAAGIAAAPGSEQQAGALLISATDQASRAFTATIEAIDSTLGNHLG